MSAHKTTLAELNERIKLGPYHQWLGVEVTDLTEDEVIFHIPFRDEMMVHPERHYTPVSYTHLTLPTIYSV